MTFFFPASRGALAGWCMGAFIVGVALHSYWYVHRFVWLAWFPVVVPLVIVLARRLSWKRRCVFLMVLCCVAGFWRFDISPSRALHGEDGRLSVVRARAPSTGIGRQLQDWRARVTERITARLPKDDAALVAGILYGERMFSRQETENFRTAGLTHIVAVSGSNVTIVVQCVTLLMLKSGLRRRHAFLVISFALILFVGFVGFAAAVARAAFMGWLVLLGREVGRPTSSFRLLLVAAVILLLIDPWQLVFDVGFALSFLAMGGLLAWAPVFERWFAWLPERFSLREIVSTTFAATLTTSPYIAWFFQRVSLAGLLTNIIALPLVPFIMAGGFAMVAWGNLPGAAYLAVPVLGLTSAVRGIAALSRHLPWLDIRLERFSFFAMSAVYALIIYSWLKLRDRSHVFPSQHKENMYVG